MPPFDGAECQLCYAALRPSTGPGASCAVSPFGALPRARPRDPAAPRGKFWVLGALGHSQEALIGSVVTALPTFVAPTPPLIYNAMRHVRFKFKSLS
jgi:hypothetical protein